MCSADLVNSLVFRPRTQLGCWENAFQTMIIDEITFEIQNPFVLFSRDLKWVELKLKRVEAVSLFSRRPPESSSSLYNEGKKKKKKILLAIISSIYCSFLFWNQSWIFVRRTDAGSEAPVLWLPDAKSWFIGKEPDASKDWRQKEKGEAEDEVVREHHWLNAGELEQTLGDSGGQRGLPCCGPWGRKESDTTEWLNDSSVHTTVLILSLGPQGGLLFLDCADPTVTGAWHVIETVFSKYLPSWSVLIDTISLGIDNCHYCLHSRSREVPATCPSHKPQCPKQDDAFLKIVSAWLWHLCWIKTRKFYLWERYIFSFKYIPLRAEKTIYIPSHSRPHIPEEKLDLITPASCPSVQFSCSVMVWSPCSPRDP